MTPRGARLIADGPRKARALFLFAHGAGAPMDSPLMQTVVEGIAGAGLRVVDSLPRKWGRTPLLRQ